MEILLAFLASPVVINFVTTFIKRIPVYSKMMDGPRKVAIRATVAVLSFLSAVGIAYMSDSLEAGLIVDAVIAFFIFLQSQGWFHLFGKKTQ